MKSQSETSNIQKASSTIANWLAFDLEHIENELVLGISQSFVHYNQDWKNFITACDQHKYMNLFSYAGENVAADQYACNFCHKSFNLSQSKALDNCHNCANKEFYQSSKLNGPIYIH